MSEIERVLFTGLHEVQVALKEMGPEATKGMNKALKDVAEVVAADARSRVPHKSGEAAASYKPHGTQRGASISFGGPKAPYAPWLDFGGSTGRGHKPGKAGSGSVHRPMIGAGGAFAGRYLYPAIKDNLDNIADLTFAAIEKVWGEHGDR